MLFYLLEQTHRLLLLLLLFSRIVFIFVRVVILAPARCLLKKSFHRVVHLEYVHADHLELTVTKIMPRGRLLVFSLLLEHLLLYFCHVLASICFAVGGISARRLVLSGRQFGRHRIKGLLAIQH